MAENSNKANDLGLFLDTVSNAIKNSQGHIFGLGNWISDEEYFEILNTDTLKTLNQLNQGDDAGSQNLRFLLSRILLKRYLLSSQFDTFVGFAKKNEIQVPSNLTAVLNKWDNAKAPYHSQMQLIMDLVNLQLSNEFFERLVRDIRIRFIEHVPYANIVVETQFPSEYQSLIRPAFTFIIATEKNRKYGTKVDIFRRAKTIHESFIHAAEDVQRAMPLSYSNGSRYWYELELIQRLIESRAISLNGESAGAAIGWLSFLIEENISCPSLVSVWGIYDSYNKYFGPVDKLKEKIDACKEDGIRIVVVPESMLKKKVAQGKRFRTYVHEQGMHLIAFPDEMQISEVYPFILLECQKLGIVEKGSQKDEKPAALWNIPYSRNSFFTGRKEVLIGLRDAHASGNATFKSLVISGLGGIGKTQTAIEYAYRYRNKYQAVLWVNAESYGTLVSDVLTIASLLGLPTHETEDEVVVIGAVQGWLKENTNWLLIFDNADEPQLVENFLPPDPKGHILVTSRAQVFDNLGIIDPIHLEKMTPDEAEEFFIKRTNRHDLKPAETEAITRLAAELDCLPLALEQAAAYINRLKCRFGDYLSSYQTRGLALLEKNGVATSKYPKLVATTWALNFEQVERTSQAAADLLRLSAFLDPHNIPLELITRGASEFSSALADALAGVEDDPLALDELLDPLAQYSLIRRNFGSRMYSIHRLVQAVVKDRMDKEEQRQWARRTVKGVSCTFPDVEFRKWQLCERLRPHAKACARLIEEWNLIFEEAAHLLNCAGRYTHDRRRLGEAEQFLKRALDIRKQIFGLNDSVTAESLKNLGSLYATHNRVAEAEPLYRQALEIQKRTLGTNHPVTAQSLVTLGKHYSSISQFDKAELLIKQALDIQEQTLGLDHPDTANGFSNLGCLNFRRGRFEEAEQSLTQAVKIQKQTIGVNNPDTAFNLYYLARALKEQRQYNKAGRLYQQALEIRQDTLGPNHSATVNSFISLADFHRDQSRFAEAESLYKQTREICKQNPSLHPIYMVTVLKGYAALLLETGRVEEAQRMQVLAKPLEACIEDPEDPLLAKQWHMMNTEESMRKWFVEMTQVLVARNKWAM